MYLLDTNVISELRPRSRQIDPNVKAWAQSVSAIDLYLSSITVLELEQGALQKGRQDFVQGGVLMAWIHRQVLPSFAGRILAFDVVAALRCAGLHIPNPAGERDAMIAATALVHGMTIVTRNEADFLPLGVTVLNPWQELAI